MRWRAASPCRHSTVLRSGRYASSSAIWAARPVGRRRGWAYRHGVRLRAGGQLEQKQSAPHQHRPRPGPVGRRRPRRRRRALRLELPVEELFRRARPLPSREEMLIDELTEEEGAAFLETLEAKSPDDSRW